MTDGPAPTCPSCGEAALEEIVERGVPFLGCGKCFALMASEDALAEYLTASTGHPPITSAYRDLLEEAKGSLAGKSKRCCPRCGEAMRRMGFGESPFMILDRCAEHGLWLDKRELKKVVRAARGRAAAQGTIPAWEAEEDEEERR